MENVGLTTNPILLMNMDICRLMQPLLLEQPLSSTMEIKKRMTKLIRSEKPSIKRDTLIDSSSRCLQLVNRLSAAMAQPYLSKGRASMAGPVPISSLSERQVDGSISILHRGN
jgi:hypothetical protein